MNLVKLCVLHDGFSIDLPAVYMLTIQLQYG